VKTPFAVEGGSQTTIVVTVVVVLKSVVVVLVVVVVEGGVHEPMLGSAEAVSSKLSTAS